MLFSPQFDLACPVSICAINLVTVGGWMTRQFSGVGSLISGSFTVLRLDITQCTLVQSCRLCPHFWPITGFEDTFRRSKTDPTLVSLQGYYVDESGETQPQS